MLKDILMLSSLLQQILESTETNGSIGTEWDNFFFLLETFRSSSPEVFLGKGVLKIRSKFKGEHACRNAISMKLLCNFIEIAL